MSKLIQCTGTYAHKPYYISKIGINVHSVEELCYSIVQYAFILDSEDFDSELTNWLSEECGLKKLAEGLEELLRRKGSAAGFAGMILEYVRYNTAEEINKTKEIMRANAGMNVYEKKMARADYLMNNGKYDQAFLAYEALLKILPQMEHEMHAKIAHNRGVILTGLFDYENAAVMFRKEYEDRPTEEAYLCYLAALRMSMPEKKYIAFIGSDKEAYSFSMKLEKRMNEASDLYDASEDKHLLNTLAVYKNEGKTGEYYAQVGKIAEELKEEYRNLVTDAREIRR